MTPFRLAFLNLSRKKTPSIVAVLAIALSVACSGILLRLNLISENRFSTLGKGGDAIVGAKAGGIEILLSALNGEGDYPGFLPYKLFESLKSEQIVTFEDGQQSRPAYLKSIIPFVYFAKFKNFRIVGTDESFVNRPLPEDSLLFLSGHWSSGIGEVVLGSMVAIQSGLNVGDTISAQTWVGSTGSNISLKIVGIFQSTGGAWDRMLFTNIRTAHETLATVDLKNLSIWGPQVLNYFMVYLQPNGFNSLATLVNRRTVGQAILVQQQEEKLKQLTGAGTTLGLFVTILILALSSLSVAAMLITRFDAMALQLAVLRALGYKKKAIGQWLLWEGFLLGIVACIIGVLFDGMLFPIIRGLLGSALPPADIVVSSIFQSFPVWCAAIVATMASVFIPLYRVYRQDVHFSLKN